MAEYVIIGALVGGFGAVALVVVRRIVQKNAAKRAARAEHAHSEPGGPHAHHHGGAPGDASARLADRLREGSGGG